MVEMFLKLIVCHLIGDYVLRNDFIAKTKGENWYHLLVHCGLYILPFYLVFESTWQLAFIFIVHLFVDSLKARYNKINYSTDQLLHYLSVLVYLF